MDAAINIVGYILNKREQRTASLIKDYGEDLGHLRAALDTMSQVYTHAWQPLEDIQIYLLSRASNFYLFKQTEYFGQEYGLPLHPKREVDRRAGERFSAALNVFDRNHENPKEHPIGEALFELAGQPYGMSASVVKRAYYSPTMQEDLQSLRKAMNAKGPEWSKTVEK